MPIELLDAAGILSELPVEDVLQTSALRECRAYCTAFRKRAQECREHGEGARANAWSLLEEITEFMLHSEDRSEPFRPLMQWGNGRTLIPTDLRGEPADRIHEFALQVSDPELRARLMDVVWEANRNHEAAEAAIPAYLESARNLFDPEHWPPCADRYERALRLATMLRRGDLHDAIIAEIEGVVLSLDGQDTLFLTIKLTSLLLEFGTNDLQSLADLSDKAAILALESSRFDQARRHLENLGACYRRLNDVEGARRAKARIAESFEIQGVMCMEAGEDLVASHWLEMAHIAYRETPGMPQKANEVYALLRTAQQQAVDSMKTMGTEPIDVTDMVKEAKEHVTGHKFHEALLRLLAIIPFTDFDRAQHATAERLEQFPLIRLASGATVSHDGRTIAHHTPMNIGEPDNNEAELWEHTVRNVVLELQLKGQAIIQPAMEQLAKEHVPTFRDVHATVGNSPLVPPGHEEPFVRGLLAGLRGDMVQALSELVPQFENGLRYLLSARGVETSSMDKMRVQDVLTMGSILSLGQLEEIFGSPDVVKEMKVLFTDDHGLKLRDRLSHGLMSSADFYTGGAYYAWWLMCRLCFAPVLVALSRADR